MSVFGGVDLFVSDLAVTRVAVKRSKRKRQQKKFIKQFGYEYVPGCITTPMGLFIHPTLFSKLNEVNHANRMD